MPIVDLYCRVSTDPQDKSLSHPEQERKCREFCELKGLTIGMVHHETHTGFEYRERPKLSLMRERVRGGQIQGVVVWMVDRFTRKQMHCAILLEELQHHKAKFYSVVEPQADDSIMGQFIMSVYAFSAELEREKIMERTISGRQAKARQGKIVAGHSIRYGWKWHDPDLKDYLVVDEQAGEVIRVAAEQYASGMGAVSIVMCLNERNVPTPKGYTVWTTRTLRRLLTDVRNTGKGARQFVWPQGKYKTLDPVDLPDGTYPALFDDETYKQIIMRAKVNKAESARNGKYHTEYLLRAGFVRCSECKRAMIGCYKRDARNKNAYHMYVCNKDHTCAGYRVPSKGLDEEVWTQITELADHIALIEQAVALASKRDNSAANLKSVERTLAEWQSKVDNYTDDLQDSTLKGASRAAIRKLLDDALSMVERLEDEKAKILAGTFDRQREHDAYNEILEWCRTVKTAREELSYQKKRDYLRMLGVVVMVNRVPRKKHSPVSYDVQLSLPALQAVLGANRATIEGPCRTKTTHFIEIVKGVWRINPELKRARNA